MGKSKFYTHILPNLDRIELWAQKGATAKEIAEKLGVSYSSFKSYLARGEKGEPDYSDFLASFTRACAPADDDIEAALFNLAKGYTVDLRKTFKVRRVEYDKKTGRKLREYEELVQGVDQQHVPGNVQAQMFWLTNRRRDRWEYRPVSIRNADTGEEAGVLYLAPTAPLPEPPETDVVIESDGEVVT